MAAPLNPNSKAGLIRAVMADKYPAWSDAGEIYKGYAARPGAPSTTIAAVTTALSQMEKRGMIESMAFNGARAKSWRLKGAGIIAALEPSHAPAPTRAIPDNAVANKPATHLDIDLGPVVDRVIDQIVEAFRAQLEKRLSDELEQVLATQASAALEKLPSALFREPTGPLKQVTIVGLLDKQAGMLHQEYRKEFKLQFVASDHYSGPRLKGLAASSEAVIVMTDFVKHAVDEIVLSVGGNLIRCPGGMTHLREKLDSLYLAEAA